MSLVLYVRDLFQETLIENVILLVKQYLLFTFIIKINTHPKLIEYLMISMMFNIKLVFLKD